MAKKTTGTRGPKKGSKYNNDPMAKLEAGEPWKINLILDKEVGLKILADVDKCPQGTEYQYIINKQLKKSYGIKPNK